MKVKLILERATIEMKLKGEVCRKVVEVEIPDTDNSEAEKKGYGRLQDILKGERMTKEELKQEAEEYANNLAFVFETDIVQRIVRERVRLALIDVLEPREKRIKELEAQIEKMKCCENCRYCNKWGEANSNSPNCKKCNWVSNWKLRG